ncbi:hypothetical protein [Paracoccus endophyticus]|uniref:hypothetical protein n=1 Tax=Paracoccus endophyticus TaxID=2233774 RepID=UPI0013A697C5|nr:hypothetical protein [Paracoccus endophyticus]
MKVRTIVISAAAVILGMGAAIRGFQGPRPCTVTSQGVTERDGRPIIVGTSSCESGTVILVFNGLPFDLSVSNSTFGGWLVTDSDKAVSVIDIRK